jgi:hypothetical protein
VTPFRGIDASAAEKAMSRPGDDIVSPADVVMDRAFTVDGPPDAVWPWLAQLGKQRAGWYLPRTVERFVPSRRRATRTIDARWQRLQVGDVIPDYGGRHETFEVAEIHAPSTVVYRSRRGHTDLTWSISLQPVGARDGTARTRVFLRLRMGPVRRKWLAETAGGLLDLLTIAGMAAGLRERLAAEQ